MSEDKWYGFHRHGTYEIYDVLSGDPSKLFEKLSRGHASDEPVHEASEIPDLRTVLIQHGKNKLHNSLGQDWQVLKTFNIYNSMDEILNLLYEKSMALSLKVGETKDSPSFFRLLSEFTEPDYVMVGNMGLQMEETKNSLRHSLEKEALRMFPNGSRLIDPLLCIELLSHFNSLQRLAEAPASAIQIAGAEKALFMSKVKHVKGPKHGIIFKSSIVSGAALKYRGRVARRLALKLSLAFRADVMGHVFDQKEINAFTASIKKNIS